MELEHTFTVPVGVKQAWDVLLDLPRIAPCMPGATLTEHTDDGFAGTVKVKLGPVNLTYKGTGKFTERDEDARRVVIDASGRDTRSSGTAAAVITATLHPVSEDVTEVKVLTDLKITGRPAQFGRGVLADVGGRLIGQFAECLAGKLQTTDEPPAVSAVPDAGPAAALAAAPAVAEVRERPVGERPHLTAVPTPAEVEAIDLLEVAGVNAMARRYAPYAVSFAAGAALVWLFTGRRRG